MKTLDRMGAIRQSLAVFYYGLAGFLPVIGLLPATMALIRGFRVGRAYAAANPADNYRKWGMALGACCLLMNLYAAFLVAAKLFDVAQNGGAMIPWNG